MLICPACNRRGIGLLDKFWSGSDTPCRCRHCGGLSYIHSKHRYGLQSGWPAAVNVLAVTALLLGYYYNPHPAFLGAAVFSWIACAVWEVCIAPLQQITEAEAAHSNRFGYLTVIFVMIIAGAFAHCDGSPAATASDDSDAIYAAGERASSCEADAIAALFGLSLKESRASTHNATNAEALSGANEQVFLSCPNEFLKVLSQHDHQAQSAVAYYFAIFETERVRSLLGQFASHPDYAALVERNFAHLLDTATN